MPEIRTRLPHLKLGDIAVLYPAAFIGDHVAEAAQTAGLSILRSDGNALYPRGSRLMRWLEQCAEWCCGGWKSGSPRFGRITSEGQYLFAEVLSTEDARLVFQQRLIDVLWGQKNESELLARWLQNLYDALISDLAKACRTMEDDVEILRAFIGRCSEGDCQAMTISLNLTTLHSSKGREFSVVIMIGIDAGRLPRKNSTSRELVESRRLFYVGLTRAKTEVHMMFSARNPSQFISELQRRLDE